MTRFGMLPRRAAGLGTAIVLAVGLAACSGPAESDDSPASAPPTPTTDEFCSAWEEALTELAMLGTAEPDEESWEKVRALLTDLVETGAPEELSADATAGLAVFTDSLIALDHEDVARLKDADNLPGVTDEQEAQSRAFTQEAAQLCGKLG
jgi:hypothetical protein